MMPDSYHTLLHIQATQDYNFSGWCYATPFVELQLKAQAHMYTLQKVSGPCN